MFIFWFTYKIVQTSHFVPGIDVGGLIASILQWRRSDWGHTQAKGFLVLNVFIIQTSTKKKFLSETRKVVSLRLLWVTEQECKVRCLTEVYPACGKMAKSIRLTILFVLTKIVWMNKIRSPMGTTNHGKFRLHSQCSLYWTVHGVCGMHSTPITDQWGAWHDSACSLQGKISLKRPSA